jgi:hypothetical protein
MTSEPLDLEPIKERWAWLPNGEWRLANPTGSGGTEALDYKDVRSLLAEVERLRNTEAWDEVERLRGVIERLELEKHGLAERLMRMGSKPT